MTDVVLLTSPRGNVVAIPVGGHHEPLDAWTRRGWTVPAAEPAQEPGFAPIAFAPVSVASGTPLPADAGSQDDVALPVSVS